MTDASWRDDDDDNREALATAPTSTATPGSTPRVPVGAERRTLAAGSLSPQNRKTREVIGSYEVVRKLAEGGMGEVLLARQLGPVDFSRPVVLKLLRPRFAQDQNHVTMFLNEARISASLQHPNIVHVYEVFQHRDGYAMVMEHVHGGNVLSLLTGREAIGTPGIPFGPAIRIARALCAALDFAYNEVDDDGVPRKIIHRDLNPSNVLVGFDGQVKLADFGIAKALDTAPLTSASTIKGKYGYLSPEQIRCVPLDQRSDIFALGTMLWEMTVGAPLFQRDGELEMMRAILQEPIAPPSQRVADYPPELERIVMKALSRDREDRYRDTRELEAELRKVARDHGWDTEAPELAKVAKQAMRDDHALDLLATGSGSLSQPIPTRAHTSPTWRATGSYASLVEIPQPTVRREPPLWLTLLVLTAATAVFWLLVVPRLT